MIYTEMTKLALKICFEVHKDQVDKSGLPYAFHPFHIAEQMENEDEIITALLHDVVEDGGYTLSDLAALGFSERVIDAIDHLTHREGVSYEDYVAKIAECELARTVKLADLKHNSDLSRLSPDEIHDAALERWERYQRAIKQLSE